jgi:nicotinic acid phosphoribosyltransferase
MNKAILGYMACDAIIFIFQSIYFFDAYKFTTLQNYKSKQRLYFSVIFIPVANSFWGAIIVYSQEFEKIFEE